MGNLWKGDTIIKIGRVIRFEWGPELLRRLHEDSVQAIEPVQGINKPVKKEAKKSKMTNKKSTTINWDC